MLYMSHSNIHRHDVISNWSLVGQRNTSKRNRIAKSSHMHLRDTSADIIFLTKCRGGYGSLLPLKCMVVAIFRIWWRTFHFLGALTTAPSQNRYSSASCISKYILRFFNDQWYAQILIKQWFKIDFIYLFCRVKWIRRELYHYLLPLHPLVKKSYSHHVDQVQRRQVSAGVGNRVINSVRLQMYGSFTVSTRFR